MVRKKIEFTAEGLENIQKEYADLKKQRVSAVEELTVARDMGDRSENAAYKSARWKLSSIDRRTRALERTLKNAIVVNRPFTGMVDIGCQVTIVNQNTQFVYTIVGSYESNIGEGKLSIRSPIGSALLGKKVGERVSVFTPKGIVGYLILNISSANYAKIKV